MKPPLPGPPQVFIQPPVVISQPPEGSSGPLPYPISDPNGCKISASGFVADPHATQITAVSGSVNGGASQGGTWTGLTWQVGGVGKAVSGSTNTFTVEVTYTKDDGSSATKSASRDFLATGFSGSCSGSLLVGVRRPIARLMPRYYKLLVDVHSLPPSAQGESLLLGGLLGRTPVYLAYDLALSTPAEPVWRDINLPSSAGHWTLRVRSSGCGLAGELVLQGLSETEVLPPLIFRCASWTFAGFNFLAPDSAALAGGGPAVAVVAEPA